MIRTSPKEYFEETPTTNSDVNYYPILLAVLIGGLIAITALAIAYRK